MGRPPRDAAPKLPPEEAERLLVEGELVPGPDGEPKRVWPTQRDLAERFGVSPSLVAQFALEHGCTERRAELRAQLEPPPLPPAPSTSATDDGPTRSPGRPRHQDAPQFSHEELDRLLVFGEVLLLEDGTPTTVYPSYRTLADRYGVAPSVIATYARTRNTMRRRKQNAARITARTEEKLIDLRSDVLAVGEERLVQMIDEFLLKFAEALDEGRVRTDSVSDVNTLVRLKQFILGGADSRQEVRTVLSLESLQERYARTMRQARPATSAMSGVIDVRGGEVGDDALAVSRVLGGEVGDDALAVSSGTDGRNATDEKVSKPEPPEHESEQESEQGNRLGNKGNDASRAPHEAAKKVSKTEHESEQVRARVAGGEPQPPAGSDDDVGGEPNVAEAALELAALARELAEAMGADPDDEDLLENRVLRATDRVEAAVTAPAAPPGADVGPWGEDAPEGEG